MPTPNSSQPVSFCTECHRSENEFHKAWCPKSTLTPSHVERKAIEESFEGRHPSTQHMAKQFNYGHLPPFLQAISGPIHDLAMDMVNGLEDGPELTAGLRKLLEAKDCFVRARLDSDPVVYHDR